MRELTLLVVTLTFAACHLVWYTRVVALRLSELTGGIQRDGQLTAYGTSNWAWSVPVHLPAGILFVVGLDVVGLLLVFAGSLVAGFAAAELLLACRVCTSSAAIGGGCVCSLRAGHGFQ